MVRQLSEVPERLRGGRPAGEAAPGGSLKGAFQASRMALALQDEASERHYLRILTFAKPVRAGDLARCQAGTYRGYT
jgi:hypothetical protein